MENAYTTEARERWGSTDAYREHERNTKNYSKEKWAEATDDIVKALSLDWDRKALYLANTLKEPAFTMLVSKIKVQSAKSPNEATWPYIIGTMYEQSKQYAKAIEYYETANSKDVSPVVHQRIPLLEQFSFHISLLNLYNINAYLLNV